MSLIGCYNKTPPGRSIKWWRWTAYSSSEVQGQHVRRCNVQEGQFLLWPHSRKRWTAVCLFVRQSCMYRSQAGFKVLRSQDWPWTCDTSASPLTGHWYHIPAPLCHPVYVAAVLLTELSLGSSLSHFHKVQDLPSSQRLSSPHEPVWCGAHASRNSLRLPIPQGSLTALPKTSAFKTVFSPPPCYPGCVCVCGGCSSASLVCCSVGSEDRPSLDHFES